MAFCLSAGTLCLNRLAISAAETSIVSVCLEQAFRETAFEEIARAQRRIAELERKIGQQQVELVYSRHANGSQSPDSELRR
jgi:hypothetical protein